MTEPTTDPALVPPTRSATGEHAEPAHHEGTLRGIFTERRISLASMDRPLKLATGAALGCAFGAAVLVALRDVGDHVVTLGVTAGVRSTLSTALFAATLVFLAIGLSYLVTGAVLAHRAAATIGVLVITGLIGYETGTLGIGGVSAVLPAWAHWATRALLAAIVAVALAVLIARRGRHGDDRRDRRLRIATLATYTALFTGYLVTLAVASPTVNGLSNFPTTVDLLMVDLALLATPFLQVAALDFGEWGAILTERGHSLFRRRLPSWLLPALGCVALAVIGVVRAHESVAGTLLIALRGIVLLIIAALLVVGLARALRFDSLRWPTSFGFAALFVVTAAAMWVIAPITARATGLLTVDPTPTVAENGIYTAAANVRTVHVVDGFTMLVPAGWETKQVATTELVAGVDPALGTMSATMTVVPAHATTRQYAQLLHLRPTGPTTRNGDLHQQAVALGADKAGFVWDEPVPGQSPATLVIEGIARSADPAPGALELRALVNSIRPPGTPVAHIPSEASVETSAEAAAATTDRIQAFSMAIEVAVSVIALLLVATIGRAWPGRVRVTALLFAILTLFYALFFWDAPARAMFGLHGTLPVLTVSGLLMGVAILGGGALLIAGRRTSQRRDVYWARQLPGALCGLVGGIAALYVMDVLYTHALSVSRVALWAPVILLLAVAWDVTMSGESMTNSASRVWPRNSRVLLFFGYVILTGATVVYYSGQRAAGSGQLRSETFFEPEAVTDAALFRVALPALVLAFILRLHRPKEPAPGATNESDLPPPGAPEPAVAAGRVTG